MISLDLKYRCGNILLAEIDPEHYITEDKVIIYKYSSLNFSQPVIEITPTKQLQLSDEEYNQLTANWRKFLQFKKEQGNN